jgi:regulator of protease activity HflC (stomatin/prohibitin superfamily)
MSIAKYILFGVVAILALILGACSMTTVDTGHRGVKVSFGEVIGESLTEGLYFVNPLTTHIEELDTRVNVWNGETQAYTKDVQQASIHFTLNYRLDPAAAHIVFREVGKDWIEKLVAWPVYQEVKRELGQYEAVALIGQRDAAARKIESDITKAPRLKNVLVTGFQLTNVDYSPEFEKAVEAKVTAVQNAIAEKNRSVQVEEKARQQVLTAEGNARATVTNAKAEAESISIRARALEQNAKLVEWEAVQKWNGELPTYMLGGATPFIQVPGGR